MAGRGPAPKAFAAAARPRAAASPERPDPPAGLGKAGEALWRQIQDDVDDAYELDAREEALLERACKTADLAADLERDLRERGRWIEGSTGRQRLNPAVGELRLANASLTTILSKVELGASAPRTGHLNRRQRNVLRDVADGRR